jgi:hypothetical protein
LQTRIVMAPNGLTTFECKGCGGKCKRLVKGPSSQVMEKLDNGSMVRAVERLANAEILAQDRAKNSDPLAGGAQRSER